VPRIHLGDPAAVNILGKQIPGKVARIGSIVGRNRLTSLDPRALRDLRVVEVSIRLDDAAAARHYVNMEVEAEVQPAGSAPASGIERAGPPSAGPG
jgi:HlyD family secretion protein